MGIANSTAGSRLRYGARRFISDMQSATTTDQAKEVLRLGCERIKIGVVVNTSEKRIAVKSESDWTVIWVEPKQYKIVPFDGIASWNGSQGKVVKCRDFSVAYVAPDGLVACQFLGTIDSNVYLDSPPDNEWNAIFETSDLLQNSGDATGASPDVADSPDGPHHDHEPSIPDAGDFEIDPRVGSIA
jgi:hypothetical protein